MKKIIGLIICSFILHSCMGIIDKEKNIPVKKLNKEDLIGLWTADKFSYEFDFSEEKIDSINLVLSEDGTFVMHNGIIREKRNVFFQGDFSGTWELGKRIQKGYRDQFEIRFHIEKKKGLPGYYSNVPIYKNKDKYRIFIFIGDPDSGNRLGFENTIDSCSTKTVCSSGDK